MTMVSFVLMLRIASLLRSLEIATALLPPAVVFHSRCSARLATTPRPHPTVLYSSFAADGSEYAAGDSDFDQEDEDDDINPTGYREGMDDQEDETPTIELQPVPLSKNAGNRFVAIVWDRVLQKDTTKDALDLHYDRIRLTEDHVMFCRKKNLYNETFNTESMVDILWSLPM
jgi:hypothetical protein